MSFKHNVVVITGAASGIGRALAVEFAHLGANLALCDIDGTKLEATANICRDKGARVLAEVVDVGKNSAVKSFAAATMRSFKRVDVLISNAGLSLSVCVEKMTLQDFRRLMDVNFWGVVYCNKAFLPYLKQSEQAYLVNVSSLFGLLSVPNQSAYNASKFAIHGFTDALAMEMELENNKLQVSCVFPGGIKTNIANNSIIKQTIGSKFNREQAVANFNQKLARTSATQAARQIINGMQKNHRRILIGADAKLVSNLLRLLPVSYMQLLKKLMR